MRYNKFLLLLILSCSAYFLQAQPPTQTKGKVSRVKKPAKVSKYKLEQFDGRWQEISRTSNKTKEAVAISDTIFIYFYDGTRADTREGNSVVISGTAAIDKNDDITTSARDFHIVSVTENEIVLDDMDGFSHNFVKKDIFSYELPVPSAAGDPVSEKIAIEPTAANLIKNWFVYRRGANPGFIRSETPVIKGLDIKEAVSDGVYKGEVEYSVSGVAIKKPCTVSIEGNTKITVAAEWKSWGGEIFNANGTELRFGKKGEIVYYLRPL